MMAITCITILLLSSFLCAVGGIQPHTVTKDKLSEFFKSSLWNHVHSYLKINKPISIDVVSKYRIPAQTRLIKRQHKDCTDILKAGKNKKYRNGVYTIHPSRNMRGVKVYCDMTTEGGGWTVIQRRIDGSTNFTRNWADYKNGFGDVKKEYWLGNDALHLLTSSSKQELRIDLEKFSGAKAYAKYKQFSVDDENAKYRLTISGYSGSAGDSLKQHNGMFFSTKDRDNDIWRRNCASEFLGAWWYNKCHSSNLNGYYYKSDGQHGAKGVAWYHFGNGYNSMKSVKMMIRRPSS